MSLINIIALKHLGDERGSLVSIEAMQSIPFPIKRVYYIFKNQTNIARGFHAHLELKQLLICVAGQCDIVLDNGETREIVTLDSPTKGLIIESLIWREMHNFSKDCVLLVLASEHYDEADYIRDYEKFKESIVEKISS